MNTSLNIFEVEFSEEQNIEVLKLAIIKQCCTDKTGIITLSIKQAINHEEKQLLKDLSNTLNILIIIVNSSLHGSCLDALQSISRSDGLIALSSSDLIDRKGSIAIYSKLDSQTIDSDLEQLNLSSSNHATAMIRATNNLTNETFQMLNQALRTKLPSTSSLH